MLHFTLIYLITVRLQVLLWWTSWQSFPHLGLCFVNHIFCKFLSSFVFSESLWDWMLQVKNGKYQVCVNPGHDSEHSWYWKGDKNLSQRLCKLFHIRKLQWKHRECPRICLDLLFSAEFPNCQVSGWRGNRGANSIHENNSYPSRLSSGLSSSPRASRDPHQARRINQLREQISLWNRKTYRCAALILEMWQLLLCNPSVLLFSSLFYCLFQISH